MYTISTSLTLLSIEINDYTPRGIARTLPEAWPEDLLVHSLGKKRNARRPSYTHTNKHTLLCSLLDILGYLLALGVMAPDELVNYLKLSIVHIQISMMVVVILSIE